MQNTILAVLIAVFMTTVTGFQLQGSWSLTQIATFPTLYQPVSIQITDAIYREISLVQNLLFTGCQSYKYLMDSSENNLFISYASIQYQNITSESKNVTLKCDQNTAKMHSVIRSKLIEVFYFKIVGNFLVFLNAKNDIIFKFQRIKITNIRNLRGIWNLYNYKSSSISQKVQITDNQITLCQGRLIVGYTLTDKYGFKTRLISNDGCDVQDLQKTVLSSSFSRKIGTSLEVYNANLEVILLMDFVSQLDLASTQQARLKAIEDAKALQQKAAKAKADAQLKSKAQAEAQAKLQAQQTQVATSLTLTNTKQDLLGLWQPVSILKMPMDGTSVYFIIASNLISYNGGCNTFQFQYSSNQTLKTITIGQNKSTSNTCTVDDDGLYVNGISRVSKYGISIVGKEFRLKLTDTTGNVLYELKKTVKIVEAQTQTEANATKSANSNSSSTSNTKTTANAAASNPSTSTPTAATPQLTTVSQGLQNGRYVFLILARRDLSRKFLTIADNKIAYSGCNPIEHTFAIISKNQIKITGGPKSTNNKCTIDNDQILTNAFNSVTSFRQGVQTGSYVLINSKNQDVINLSQF